MSKISNDSATVPDEVDIIVAGGGAAGCTLAARIAKAAPSISILIIEAGINNKNLPQVIYPAMYPLNVQPGSKTARFHVAKPNEHLNGQEAIVPMGECLGGGSSINFMQYTRGQGIDYDGWNMDGWREKDVLPLLRKTETYHNDNPQIDRSVHGYEGDFHVSYGGFRPTGCRDDAIRASAEVGTNKVPDISDLKEANGIHEWLKWINPTTGLRQDAAHVLVHPLLEANNTSLQVLTQHQVIKVLVEKGRAIGVEYVSNPGPQFVTSPPEVIAKTVRARKLVVVSAGSLSSPCILERSGIGSKEILSKLNILIVSELPGVGENYQDHNVLISSYKSNAKEHEGFDPFLDGRRSVDAEIAALSDPSKPKYIAWNGCVTSSKLRLSDAELSRAPEAFTAMYNKDYTPHPSRPLMVMSLGSPYIGDRSVIPQGQYFIALSFTCYPHSRGRIHITSQNVRAKPDFDTGMLDNEFDVEALVQCYKRQREIVRRMKYFAGPGPGAVILGPKFPENGKAISWDWPTDNGAVTEYSKEDNEAIKQFVRATAGSTWHSCGTCAMKKREDGGVVDERLNVYGVDGLKVAGK
ncbi:hypothetical protein TWF694_005804 [Orbilia ellipsospora]|uniref:Glucose-methanol-choline oxidoreductase N-terminal domain-containing protein n=1 Tax=Orbilia ellipsospora TaxID=2528407 RepID=A0AAV9WSB0_9PEZI